MSSCLKKREMKKMESPTILYGIVYVIYCSYSCKNTILFKMLSSISHISILFLSNRTICYVSRFHIFSSLSFCLVVCNIKPFHANVGKDYK